MLGLAILAISVIGVSVGALIWTARGWLGERKRTNDCALKLNNLAHVNEGLDTALSDGEDAFRQMEARYEAQIADLRAKARRLDEEKLKRAEAVWSTHPNSPAVREYFDDLSRGLSEIMSDAAAPSGEGE